MALWLLVDCSAEVLCALQSLQGPWSTTSEDGLDFVVTDEVPRTEDGNVWTEARAFVESIRQRLPDQTMSLTLRNIRCDDRTWYPISAVVLETARSSTTSGTITLGPLASPERQLSLEGSRRVLLADALKSRVELVTDRRVISGLFTRPQDLHRLTPREFEAFVAQVLEELGYGVKLGPQGADGGVDVFAERPTPMGPEMVLVQCKRYAPHRKVGVPVVKQFNMEVLERTASRGLVVTTSSFTTPAKNYIDERRYRLGSRDLDDMRLWMEKLRSRYH